MTVFSSRVIVEGTQLGEYQLLVTKVQVEYDDRLKLGDLGSRWQP